VNVYLSDFGRARLEEEERLGPAELRSWKPQQGEYEDFSDMAKSTKRVITTHGRVITTRAGNYNSGGLLQLGRVITTRVGNYNTGG
jgi:hypothetical protein